MRRFIHAMLTPALVAILFFSSICVAGLSSPEAQGLKLARLAPFTTPPPHQARPASALTKGKFLVAGVNMKDPRFTKTVIVLTDYGKNGAIGLVINRPTGLKLNEALSGAPGLEGWKVVVYLGGPVGVDQLFMLVRSVAAPDGSIHVFGDVYVSASTELLKNLISERTDGDGVRVYAGYAGWSPLQLDREVTLGVWQVMEAVPEAIFEADPSGVWDELIYRPGK